MDVGTFLRVTQTFHSSDSRCLIVLPSALSFSSAHAQNISPSVRHSDTQLSLHMSNGVLNGSTGQSDLKMELFYPCVQLVS